MWVQGAHVTPLALSEAILYESPRARGTREMPSRSKCAPHSATNQSPRLWWYLVPGTARYRHACSPRASIFPDMLPRQNAHISAQLCNPCNAVASHPPILACLYPPHLPQVGVHPPTPAPVLPAPAQRSPPVRRYLSSSFGAAIARASVERASPNLPAPRHATVL